MELRSGTVVPPSPHARAIAQVQGHTRRPLLSAEGLGMFHHGVGLILSRWTALQLAIHNGWGGSSSHIKAQQFHDDIVSWMAQSKGNILLLSPEMVSKLHFYESRSITMLKFHDINVRLFQSI